MTKKRIIILISVILVVAISVVLIVFLSDYFANKKKEEERAWLVKEYTEQKLSTYAEENASDPDFEVIFLGDSLTDGCNIAEYYGEYIASNRGIGGDTTSGLLERIQVSAYDTNPQVIVLLIGGNDILGGKSLESIYANYEEIITGLKQHLPDTKIVWCSLSALGNKWAEHNDTCIICNQKIKLLAQKYGCTYIDLFTPLCNVETGEIYAEYTVEGVHFTDKGYKVVSSIIKKELSEIIGH